MSLMQVYFPIAEVAIPLYTVIGVGLISGILAGLFGIGGNFITIPTLIFMGISPTVAVSSAINQTVASSFASFLNQLKLKNVDLLMAFYLFISGLCGTALGLFLLRYLREKGNIDIVIFFIYIVMLGGMGSVMAFDSIRKLLFSRSSRADSMGQSRESLGNNFAELVNRLPLRIYFRTSKREISLIALLLFGMMVGLILSFSGVGGGFLLVPVLIYVFKLSTRLAIGTSVAQSVLVSTVATLLHSVTLGTVDILLAFLLSIGAIFGVVCGAKLNLILPSVILRLLLTFVMFVGVFRLLFTLFMIPEDFYSFFVVQ